MTRHQVDHMDVPIAGYTDRLSARPGERISVSASSTIPDVEARVLRIGHDGQDPVRTAVDTIAAQRIRVPHQDLDLGSYGLVVRAPVLGNAVMFAAWIWPTAWPEQWADVLSQGSAEHGPFAALSVRADGRAAFEVATERGPVSVVSDRPLNLRRWYLLAGGYHAQHGARLYVVPRDPLATERQPELAGAPAAGPLLMGAPPLVLAARRVPSGRVTGNFDGKIDQPCVFDRVLRDGDVAGLASGAAAPSGLAARAGWDLARDIGGDQLVDVVGDWHGWLHNGPLRGVTGHDWTGDVLDWRHAPRGYGAVHFHSDDLADAGWDPVLEITLPGDLPSGLYAVELENPVGVDRLPFFVRPRRGRITAPLALLVPTLSYLAYALDHLKQPFTSEDPVEVAARFARANTLHSLYDRHIDGSGVCLASLRRPLLGMRDDHVFRYTSSPHQYSQDVALAGWLGRQDLPFDVLTDHDLDDEGAEALAGYRAVITGSHPEYWTGVMLDAVTTHLHSGGKLGYLGGNGAYWVTAIPRQRRYLAELRRGYSGVRTWECEPGELHLASTGEPGGLWAERGRAPHRLFGIGTTAAGMSTGAAYQVLAEPGDPLVDRVLAGVDRAAPLGGFGSVLDGAASFETDGIDPLLGSPPGIRLLGRALLGEQYMSADTGPAFPHPLGDPVDRRRADLTLLDTAGGGTVFATGSIGWCGALSHDKDDNDVSRLTAAVLRRFCDSADREGNH